MKKLTRYTCAICGFEWYAKAIVVCFLPKRKFTVCIHCAYAVRKGRYIDEAAAEAAESGHLSEEQAHLLQDQSQESGQGPSNS